MKLDELVQRLEKRVWDFGKRVVPGVAHAAWNEEVEQLRAQLNEHYGHALHYRDILDQLRARIADNETRAALLASRIETYVHTKDAAQAYPLAIELDQVRVQLASDQAQLPSEERAYRTHRERIAELERRLSDLRRKMNPNPSF